MSGETIQWKKSSFSPPQSGDSVQVARDPENPGIILISESDESFGGGITRTDPEKFADFLKGAKAGEFDGFAS